MQPNHFANSREFKNFTHSLALNSKGKIKAGQIQNMFASVWSFTHPKALFSHLDNQDTDNYIERREVLSFDEINQLLPNEEVSPIAINIAIQWFDAQIKSESPCEEHPLDYLITHWANKLISVEEIQAAARVLNIKGEFPHFFISNKLVLPDTERLKGINYKLGDFEFNEVTVFYEDMEVKQADLYEKPFDYESGSGVSGDLRVQGIEISSRYRCSNELQQMMNFANEVYQYRLNGLIREVFYDSNSQVCSFTFVEEIDAYSLYASVIRRIAKKHISQFEWFGSIDHSNALSDMLV